MEPVNAPEAANLVRAFLANLMKAALTSDDQHSLEWRGEAERLRDQIARTDAETLGRLKLDGLWWLALGDATPSALRREQGQIEFAQPIACPVAMHEIVSAEVAIDRLVDRLIKSASTG
ncbi:MAG: hypothetical protein PGN34_05755 [Methylobacterium frigidaeris]